MFKKIYFSVISLLMVNSIAPACSKFKEIKYDVQDIGTLQTNRSYAIAINDQGQILGWYNLEESKNERHYFVRDREGTFHELPKITSKESREICWQWLRNDGKAYGTVNHVDTCNTTLYMWDQQKGVIELGVIPTNEIEAINDAGQVLLCGISDEENGKRIVTPAIWKDGNIVKLQGLEGNIGIKSDRSVGYCMNNKGEVVGVSEVYINYKNKIYKQFHAVKWSEGKVIDLHCKIPKSTSSEALSINDQGDIIINASSKGKGEGTTIAYLLKNDEKVVPVDSFLRISTNKYMCSQTSVFEIKNNRKVMSITAHNLNDFLANPETIWMSILRIIGGNDKGEIIAEGMTIYGEEHAILLIPINAQMVTENTHDKCIEKSDERNELPKENVLLGPFIADYCGSIDQLIEQVQAAIVSGADVNDKSRNGHCPLQLAIRKGYMAVACLLIENGADIHYIDKSWLDPIHTAINYGQFKVAKLLVKYGAHVSSPPDLSYNYSQWYKFKFS